MFSLHLPMRFLLFVATVLLFSCSDKNEEPDVSDIKIDVNIKRFDQDFFSIDTTRLDAEVQKLGERYPSFLPLYFEYFSPVDFIVKQQGRSFTEAFTEYYRNIKPLWDSSQKRFSNLNKIENALEKSFKYVKYYFPNWKVADVLTTVESLNPENPSEVYGTTYFHDTLVISLQMFLGGNFSVYDPAQYPEYIRRRFEPEYIVPNSIRAISTELYADSSEGALVEQMIEKGKRWYLMKKLLPDYPDTLITGYTKKQSDWCDSNEGNIWGYINQNENLYSNEQSTLQIYIGEAPFTSTLPHGNAGEGAPGNIGAWVGLQIVESFAKQNAALSLPQLLRTPARKIFQESRYRPK